MRTACLAIFISEDLEMQRQRKHAPCSVAVSEMPFSFCTPHSAFQKASLAVGAGVGTCRRVKAETLETQRPHEWHQIRVASSQNEGIYLRHSCLWRACFGVCVEEGLPSTLALGTECRPLSGPCDYSEASPPGSGCRNKS